MIKNIFLILFSLLTFHKNEESSKTIGSEKLSQLNLTKYSKKDLTIDFNILVNSLKEAHTGLYWYNTEKEFDNCVLQQKNILKDSLNGLEFYNIVAPIVAFTKEDHCDIHLSKSILKYLKNEGKFMPLSVLSVHQKIYILNNPTDEISIKGFELLKVNQKPITEIYKTLFNTFASDGYIQQSKYRWLDNVGLSKLYARTIEQSNTYELELRNPKSNEIINVTLNNTDYLGLKELNKKMAFYKDSKPAQLEFLSKYTAKLTVNTFSSTQFEENKMNFKDFISDSFKKINALNIKNLIIDVRENGGGNEGYEDYLFSFLTDKPYNKYKDVEISAFKYSFYQYTNLKKEHIKELEKESKKEHYLANDGRILRKKGIMEIAPLQPNSFKGNLYILTSGWTYSGGAEFSSLVKQHTNATFIGEEVGGGFYGNTSGFGLDLILPNTKLSIDIPVLKFSLDVNKGEFGRGVLPDYEIQPTFNDFITKKDAVMEFTKKLIIKEL